MKKLYHFTDKKLNAISPQFFGKNAYSKNEALASGIKRAFFYGKAKPQEYLLEGTAYRYTVTVKKSSVYDLRKDCQGLIKKAGGDIDKLLRLIKRDYIGAVYDCGFICYILFKSIKVESRAELELGKWKKC
jgi:hypothetical protein